MIHVYTVQLLFVSLANVLLHCQARAEGFEPPNAGFGSRCLSPILATPLCIFLWGESLPNFLLSVKLSSLLALLQSFSLFLDVLSYCIV